jgi:hypothetical protein
MSSGRTGFLKNPVTCMAAGRSCTRRSTQVNTSDMSCNRRMVLTAHKGKMAFVTKGQERGARCTTMEQILEDGWQWSAQITQCCLNLAEQILLYDPQPRDAGSAVDDLLQTPVLIWTARDTGQPGATCRNECLLAKAGRQSKCSDRYSPQTRAPTPARAIEYLTALA